MSVLANVSYEAPNQQVGMLVIREDDLSDRQSRELIALHLTGMSANVPHGALYLDPSDLQQSNVTVWSAWNGLRVVSVGALKTLSNDTGEVKSMRTHPDFTGRGAGSRIMKTIIEAGKARGFSRLYLETGSGRSFEAARLLYEKFGFRRGEAYADHKQTDFNHFLYLDLDERGRRSSAT